MFYITLFCHSRHNPSQAFTEKHVSFPRLTATTPSAAKIYANPGWYSTLLKTNTDNTVYVMGKVLYEPVPKLCVKWIL